MTMAAAESARSVPLHRLHVFDRRGESFAFSPAGPYVIALSREAARLCGASEAERAEVLRDSPGLAGELDVLCGLGAVRRPHRIYGQRRCDRLARQYRRWPVGGLELYMVEGCNLRCRYCYEGANGSLNGGRMPPEVIDQAAVFQARRGAVRRGFSVVFFGGEPLLNLDGLDYAVRRVRAVARAVRRRPRFAITTNATLVDRAVARFLFRNRFSVTVSWDGGPEVQNRMRPGPSGAASYDATRAGYDALVGAGLQPSVRAPVTSACWDRSPIAAPFAARPRWAAGQGSW